MAAARAERRLRLSRSSRGAISSAAVLSAAVSRVAVALFALAAASACSDDSSSDGPADMGGSGGTGMDSLGSNGGSQQAGGSASGGGAATGASASGGTGATGGSGNTSGYTEVGVCGRRGESPVSADSFEGYEEYYLIGEDGFGDDICVVRFKVSRVGEAPPGCEACAWTHRVKYSDPEVLTDENDVCANSELGMSAAKIAQLDGSEASFGYVYEYAGHVSVLLKYDEATSMWGPNGNASWSEETGVLNFDQRNGFCGY
jgi:hypothetical protein